MGIKGINDLIRKLSPDAIFTLPIEDLNGKRIAIDGNLWMHTNMATSRKKVIELTDLTVNEIDLKEIRRLWIMSLLNFIIIWLSYNITPVFIIDGTPPKEKDETRIKRREDTNIGKIKIEKLFLQLKNGDINVIDELKKELRNTNSMIPEDYLLFKELLNSLGIPCLQATGDGEQLCSMLCLEGKVAAVWSNDTDNLVYGCPLLITKFSSEYIYDVYGNRTYNLCCVRIDKVLKNLNISFDTFVDLCIMSGCDYNINIRGIGCFNAYKLLLSHSKIENLPERINIDCLNYKRCREIFNTTNSTLLIKNTQENFLDLNFESLLSCKDYFASLGILPQIRRLTTFYQKMTPSSPGSIEHLNLESISKNTEKLIYTNKFILRICE